MLALGIYPAPFIALAQGTGIESAAPALPLVTDRAE